MRRKGEKKLDRVWPEWGPAHPVYGAIKRGSGWFNAWYSQACTPWEVIEKRTHIPAERLAALDRSARPTHDEIVALAKAWQCTTQQIAMSIASWARR